MLRGPPQFSQKRWLRDTVLKYDRLPITVAPQGKWDIQAAQPEAKLGDTVQYFVAGIGGDKEKGTIKGFALVRSCFEDVRQYRKHNALRGMKDRATVLEPRPNDDRERVVKPKGLKRKTSMFRIATPYLEFTVKPDAIYSLTFSDVPDSVFEWGLNSKRMRFEMLIVISCFVMMIDLIPHVILQPSNILSGGHGRKA